MGAGLRLWGCSRGRNTVCISSAMLLGGLAEFFRSAGQPSAAAFPRRRARPPGCCTPASLPAPWPVRRAAAGRRRSGLGAAMLVLDRHGLPEPFRVLQGDALRVGPELDDVAVSAEAQPTADHLHPSGDEQAAAPFGLRLRHGSGRGRAGLLTVRRFSAHCCSRWMSAHWRRQKQKCWMPDSGQPVVRAGHQDSLSQVTPSGRVLRPP